MSILSSLVYKDQDKAVSFIHQLSQVYRYLLDNAGQELRTLEEEIQFISSYTYLLNIRYSPNLVFRFDIEEEKTRLLIPPLAIQLLIENAIKHNIVSSEQPLTISISTKGDKLIVENNLQLRVSKLPSAGTGLRNIGLRYRYFTVREPEISKTATTYIVKIPLLQPV
jgi:sensor histidine kinase YesM